MRFLSLIGICLLLSACANTIPATPNGFVYKQIQSDHFTFSAWEKDNIQPNKTLRIYLEGSGTPNPKEAIALDLAQKDSFNNTIVLMRPCQYDDKNELCTNAQIYTQEQYNPEIISEIQKVITHYQQKYKAKNIELVAYDTSAPIAMFLATKMPNISFVVTVAGVLDIDDYTKRNNLPAFINAQNPAQNNIIMAQIKQIHYVGKDDTVTPREVTEKFVKNLKNPQYAVVKLVPNTDHDNWQDVDLGM